MAKIALVTGGGSGIGAATALKLAETGYRVCVADIDRESAERVAAECGNDAEAVECDVTDGDAVAAMFAEVARLGQLSALVNNAGAGGSQTGILEFDLEGWNSTLRLLLTSAALCTHHAAKAMSDGGTIVNVASVASFGPGYSPLAYAVAKAGVLQLTKVTAAELAHRGIRVNAVCPGMILTGIYTAGFKDFPAAAQMVDAHMRKQAPKAQPLQIAGIPEHIADNIAHLLSDKASFVTGTHLIVDGGMLVGPRHSWDPEIWEQRQQDREALYASAMAAAANGK
ncbi:3-oxoacyl-[acyl-carrier protein] reductase [Altererythrobacter epoxidivorans]|uniref:3-oxoacyl-[acyl-carrier protein] reductase n=1 Tax=Altererythrobacter epoxidivorans TaxID=361183 RepID=A0A0M3TA31_9SPHN|nr:SDR family oxidoreductase [Altererythrobacter epoxidivorans]ALE16056.1 3-oxoacyl-[acyl-carrier protein] reductase [Altererythrobacter epoxidivorans]